MDIMWRHHLRSASIQSESDYFDRQAKRGLIFVRRRGNWCEFTKDPQNYRAYVFLTTETLTTESPLVVHLVTEKLTPALFFNVIYVTIENMPDQIIQMPGTQKSYAEFYQKKHQWRPAVGMLATLIGGLLVGSNSVVQSILPTQAVDAYLWLSTILGLYLLIVGVSTFVFYIFGSGITMRAMGFVSPITTDFWLVVNLHDDKMMANEKIAAQIQKLIDNHRTHLISQDGNAYHYALPAWPTDQMRLKDDFMLLFGSQADISIDEIHPKPRPKKRR
ncbi:hypothetical protein FD09_GL002085 [Schleiferilactobacillus perolens DSM 12744]|jgi:hypothetical protein|uniref:Uncharacterized protein n=2 Tax=Schleiferilactobacillus perolens TaxID=100468 RepID=A0A0R1N708_9LACO|nr:hypothetical protein FD09_GL002085 [Schleiferilactobacillus perolens DSM 12744]